MYTGAICLTLLGQHTTDAFIIWFIPSSMFFVSLVAFWTCVFISYMTSKCFLYDDAIMFHVMIYYDQKTALKHLLLLQLWLQCAKIMWVNTTWYTGINKIKRIINNKHSRPPMSAPNAIERTNERTKETAVLRCKTDDYYYRPHHLCLCSLWNDANCVYNSSKMFVRSVWSRSNVCRASAYTVEHTKNMYSRSCLFILCLFFAFITQ